MTLSFFFSSRRRHTRWPRDWSSDVCSSDLKAREAAARQRPRRLRSPLRLAAVAGTVSPRSEERRVGEEGRSWGGGGAWEKKDDLSGGVVAGDGVSVSGIGISSMFVVCFVLL